MIITVFIVIIVIMVIHQYHGYHRYHSLHRYHGYHRLIMVIIVIIAIMIIMIIIVIMVMMVRTLNMFCRKTSSSSARIRSWTALWYRNSYIHHFGIIIINIFITLVSQFTCRTRGNR